MQALDNYQRYCHCFGKLLCENYKLYRIKIHFGFDRATSLLFNLLANLKVVSIRTQYFGLNQTTLAFKKFSLPRSE
jgi:hypothetical protein